MVNSPQDGPQPIDTPKKLSPIEKALIGNHICPHDNGNGRCGAQVESYQHFGSQTLRFTCARNHTWQAPIIEE